MSNLDESDKYNQQDLDNGDQGIPQQVINSVIQNQPHPISDFQESNQQKTSDIYNNQGPLLSDKPQCIPLVKKELSQSEVEQPELIEKRNRQVSKSSRRDSQDKSVISVKSARSVKSNQIPSSENAKRKKPLRRMNSKLRVRNSKILTKEMSTIQRITSNLINNIYFSFLMSLVILYALFGDDIRILTVDQQQDNIFFIFTIVCMFLFTLEIILTSIANPEYIFNFYFFLDVISTITMILDIGWITDAWYGDEGNIDNAATVKAIGKASRAARKAARVIRVIRLVRLVKLYKHARQQYEKKKQKKLLSEFLKQNRLITEEAQQKLPSLHNQYQSQLQIIEQQEQKNQAQTPQQSGRSQIKSPDDKQNLVDVQAQLNSDRQPYIVQIQQSQPSQQNGINSSFQHVSDRIININNNSNSDQLKSSQQSSKMNDQFIESKVGTILQDLVMRRVITIILSILISIPLLSYDTYYELISSYDSGIMRIGQFKDHNNLRNMLVEQYVEFHNNEIYPILQVYVLKQDAINSQKLSNVSFYIYNYQTNPEWFNYNDLLAEEYRFSDKQYYMQQGDNGAIIACGIADLMEYNQQNAYLSIAQTIFVCFVLAISALMFNKNVNDLVIEPIERMIERIDMIAQNPLEAVNIEEQEDLIMEQLEKENNQQKIRQRLQEQQMETYVLQRLIMKVGGLLAVGFGEAGSEIIAENIKKSGSVDPMIPGKKIMAIFGFCDIRNFTDATEVLQTDVMVFVNEIAEIVHSQVNSYGGSANKNIGDAFLLVWKYLPMEYSPDPQNLQKLIVKNDHKIRQKGDMAVMSFLKIITSVTISKKLEKYKKHEGLQTRMKDYSVKMGFGLHMGWGIEGAIGSSFKIDASYLSPNVNLASRLEAATKQFGSLILISGILKNYLTEACQQQLRLIDIVTVKGSIEPMELHTIDMSIKNLLQKQQGMIDKFDTSQMTQKEQKQFRVLHRYKRDQLIKQVDHNQINIVNEFTHDQEIHIARQPYNQEFYNLWKKGFQYYIAGQWYNAQTIFSQTLTMIPDHKDGPSNTLLNVIQSNGGKAPNDWKGYRELTEK